jgi:hypothetical protein
MQAQLILTEGLLDLGLAPPQHATELFERGTSSRTVTDLLQGESQVRLATIRWSRLSWRAR